MGKTLTILWQGLLDLVVPPVCWLCRIPTNDRQPLCPLCTQVLTEDPDSVCPRCASSLAPAMAAANVCPRCLTEELAFDAVVRVGPYEGVRRDVVLRSKYPGGEVLAEAMAPVFAQPLAEKLAVHRPEVAIPIPLHWRRRWARGYNQSEVLARALARTLSIPDVPGALRRVKNTAKQAKQTREARRGNVRGAFAASAKLDLTGKSVVLVDDVLTTGATAHEASRQLRKCGAKSIVVAVVAHESPKTAVGAQGFERAETPSKL